MARTYRNKDVQDRFYRKPKTYNSIRYQDAFNDQEDLEFTEFGKRNRERSRFIPTAWDDMPIAAQKELHRKRH